MKYYDKNKESSYLTYWNVNNLYFQEVPQKLPSSSFKQVKETSKFNEEFMKSYNDVNDNINKSNDNKSNVNVNNENNKININDLIK